MNAAEPLDSNDTCPAQVTDWKRAHTELVRLAGAQAGLDAEIGRWLLAALRQCAHLRLGYASFAEYAGRLFGQPPRVVSERLRVAEALETLPELGLALEQGRLCWSAVRELTRVATAATEQQWLSAASGRSVREIEQLVAGRRPGDGPGDRPDPALRRHVLRFEVGAETLSLLREALAKVRREAGSPLDDDAALLLVARSVLAGPREPGRASYQVLLQVCEDCGRGRQQAGGELIEVGADSVAMARCDAQQIESHAVEPSAPSSATQAGTHVGDPTSPMPADGGAANDADAAAPRRGAPAARATQSIPPATRRLVLRRDAGRCRVPGCLHTAFLDVHHVQPRSEGGGHQPDGLLTLCGVHHRAAHSGELCITRSAQGVSFRHADGTAYGGAVSATAAQAGTKLFGALRQLGFRETEARRALASIESHVSAGEPPADLLRRALAVLTPRAG